MKMRTNIIYRLNLKRILLIVAAFLFAQFSASTHAHDLHTDIDKAPDHQICSVCLIVTESKSDVDVDNDNTDGEAVKLLHHPIFSIPANIANPQLVNLVNRTIPLAQPTGHPYLLSRAPPLKLRFII